MFSTRDDENETVNESFVCMCAWRRKRERVCVCSAPFQAAQAFPFIVVKEQPTMQFVLTDVLQSVCASVSWETKHAGNTRAPGSLWSLQKTSLNHLHLDQPMWASCALIRISAQEEMAADKLNENKGAQTVTGSCGIWNVYHSLSMNNHRVAFLLLNWPLPWKSDEFPDMHSWDTDWLLILFDWRLAAGRTRSPLETRAKRSEGGYSRCPPEAITTARECSPNTCLQTFQLNRSLKPNFMRKKKMLPEGFRTRCYCQAAQIWNETRPVVFSSRLSSF